MSTRWADGGAVQADPRLVSRPADGPAPRWLRIAFPLLLGAIVLAMFVMPQLLRLLPDRPAIPVAGLAGQVSGTFVTSGGAMFKLYPYPENLPKFPAKAAVAGAHPLLYVRARQLSEQRLYYLSTWPGLRPVPVRRCGSIPTRCVSSR